jgi:hypothetical protein
MSTVQGQTLRLWDTQLWSHPHREGYVDWSGQGKGLAFSPDGKTLASASGHGIRFTDAGTNRPLATLGDPVGTEEKHERGLYPDALTFSRDGKSLLAAYKGGQVVLWEVATRKERHHFSPWRQEQLYEKSVARHVIQVGVTFREADWVGPMTFDPDGRVLAWGTIDGSAILWDVAAGKELLRCTGHAGPVSCLSFSPDGKTLAIGGDDGQVLLWDLSDVRPAEVVRLRKRLSNAQLQGLWADLSSEDAGKAYQAILTLCAAPGRSVPLLRERYVPTPAKRAAIARALADLDHEEFGVREKASAELARLAEVAEDAMRRLLKQPPSAEVRRRLEVLVEPLNEPGPSLRRLRAAEVLEAAGTAEARAILEVLQESMMHCQGTQ